MSTLLETERAYVPEVMGAASNARILVVGGMGGSAFPAFALRFLGASPYIIAHQDYGMPPHVPEGAQYVAISYSGETEETLSFARAVLAAGLPLSIITSGGALLALAKEERLPYVLVPEGFVPREAIGMLTKALLALMGEEHLLDTGDISYEAAEKSGETLADQLEDAVPVFYSSTRNEVLAHFGKILFNETAKVPAFWNVFPELNHNEMQGFGGEAAKPFVAVFLIDGTDDEPIRSRMERTEALLAEQGVRTVRVELPSVSRAGTFLFGRWLLRHCARSLAARYGVDPDETPLIAKFKEST